MLRVRDKQSNLGMVEYTLNRIKPTPIVVVSFALLMMVCMYPELSLAGSMEEQLEKVGTLTNGKVKTIGFSAAGILGGIGALIKGSPKLAGIIVTIGIVISLYLEWIAGGMKLIG